MTGFLSFIGSLFSSDNHENKTLELIDESFLTDDEKSKRKLEMYSMRTGFKKAQRVIAFAFVFNFTLSYWIVFLMTLFEMDTSNILLIIGAFNIGTIMSIIVAFYFGGGVIDSWNRKQNLKVINND